MWKLILSAVLMLFICLAGNGLTVLLYEGYEWLCDYFIYSILGMPNSGDTQMFVWMITGLVGIVDFILSLVWLAPMLISVVFIFCAYVPGILVPDENKNNDEVDIEGFGEGIGQIVKTLCLPVMALVYPFVLYFMKTRAHERIEIAETLVFSAAFYVSKAFAVLVFLLSLLILFVILVFMFKQVNPLIGFAVAAGLTVFLLYSMYGYGVEHAIVYGKDVGVVSFWWKFLDDFIVKNAMPWANVIKGFWYS